MSVKHIDGEIFQEEQMMNHQRSSEHGQVLVLLAVALVVLLGFTALAVDGSMVYSDRRYAQNAADAASLAGGSAAALSMEDNGIYYNKWNCSSTILNNVVVPAAVTVSVARAQDNDFTVGGVSNAQYDSGNHGVTVECGNVGTGPFKDRYLDIKTKLTLDTQTAFAHFVFSGPMRNTVEAVTRARPRQPLAFGYAIVALNEADCSGQSNGAGFQGSTATVVKGGGIFSNGCLRGDVSHEDMIDVIDASVYYHYKRSNDDLSDFDIQPSGSPQHLSPDTDLIPPSAYTLDPEPNCASSRAHNYTAAQFENDAIDADGLAPGLYCVTGNVKFNAGDVSRGAGITIVLKNGGMTINGGATIQWTAPVEIPNPAPAIPGLLIYAPPSTNSNPNTEIQINGNSASYFTGTVLAPKLSVDITGNESADAYKTQVIAYNVKAGGDSTTNVTFEANQQYSRPAYIELYK